MNREDIIRMAREAGFVVDDKAQQYQPNCIFHTQHMVDELLERFAALVAAAAVEREREACAKVCETFTGSYERGKEMEACAAAIREALMSVPDGAEQPAQQPVAMRYDFDGYGYKYIDAGSGSDWQTRILDAEPVYTSPQPAQQQEPGNWSVYNSGAEVASGLTFAEAWDYMTPDRLARQWCAVCVVDQSNLPTSPPNVPPARASKPWVGLTDEEIEQVCVPLGAAMLSFTEVARAIEAKLKEKNGF